MLSEEKAESWKTVAGELNAFWKVLEDTPENVMIKLTFEEWEAIL